MWLYFNSNGVLVESGLQHGPAARAGTTNYQIFAYFEGIDLVVNNFATIKLIKPDFNDSSYPLLAMKRVDLKYTRMSGENSEYFREDGGPNNNGIYPGFIFDFSNFDGTQNVAILLDTPGLWQAIISLYGMNHIINVQGTSTFNVQNGAVNNDGTEISIDELMSGYAASLTGKLDMINGIVVVNLFNEEAKTPYEAGQLIYVQTTETFYRVSPTGYANKIKIHSFTISDNSGTLQPYQLTMIKNNDDVIICLLDDNNGPNITLLHKVTEESGQNIVYSSGLRFDYVEESFFENRMVVDADLGTYAITTQSAMLPGGSYITLSSDSGTLTSAQLEIAATPGSFIKKNHELYRQQTITGVGTYEFAKISNHQEYGLGYDRIIVNGTSGNYYELDEGHFAPFYVSAALSSVTVNDLNVGGGLVFTTTILKTTDTNEIYKLTNCLNDNTLIIDNLLTIDRWVVPFNAIGYSGTTLSSLMTLERKADKAFYAPTEVTLTASSTVADLYNAFGPNMYNKLVKITYPAAGGTNTVTVSGYMKLYSSYGYGKYILSFINVENGLSISFDAEHALDGNASSSSIFGSQWHYQKVVTISDSTGSKTFNTFYDELASVIASGSLTETIIYYSFPGLGYSVYMMGSIYRNGTSPSYTYNFRFYQVSPDTGRDFISGVASGSDTIYNYFRRGSGKWLPALYSSDLVVSYRPTTATALTDDQLAILEKDNARIVYKSGTTPPWESVIFDKIEQGYNGTTRYAIFQHFSADIPANSSNVSITREMYYVDFSNKTYTYSSIVGSGGTGTVAPQNYEPYICNVTVNDFPMTKASDYNDINVEISETDYNNLFAPNSKFDGIVVVHYGTLVFAFRKSYFSAGVYTYVCNSGAKIWTASGGMSIDSKYYIRFVCEGEMSLS